MLVFSFNQSKPKAFVPLAWAGAVLAGMAAEQLITMGVKGVSKAVLKKQADDYAARALQSGAKFDFMGTNPYRNKDGSITLSPTANDRAKLAGLMGGALTGLFAESLLDSPESSCPPPVADTSIKMPVKMLAEPDDDAISAFNFVSRFATLVAIRGTPAQDAQYEREMYQILLLDKGTGVTLADFGVQYDTTAKNWYLAPYDESSTNIYVKIIPNEDNAGVSRTFSKSLINTRVIESQKTAELLGYDIGVCNGLYIPSSVERIYDIPLDVPDTFVPPNYNELVNKTIVINNVLPPSEQEGEVTWNEIEDYYNVSGKDFTAVMDSNIDTYLANGVIKDNSITAGHINNYYTDINYDEKKEDLEIPIVEPELPEPIPDGGELVPVDPIDRSLLQIAKESYQYLADTVKSSVDGLTAVTAGATGVITFLGTTMGWLPNEWIVMFSAAFGLGLFAFFFRR